MIFFIIILKSLDSFDLQSDLSKVKFAFAWQVSLVLFPLPLFPIWYQGWGNIRQKSEAEVQCWLTQHLLEAATEVLPLSRRRDMRWEWNCVVWNDT